MNDELENLKSECEEAAKILKSLAHPLRLQILCHLSQNEMAVSEIESLCSASQSSISQFLNRMKSEGLINSRRVGNFVFYRIYDLKVKKLIQAMHKIYCP
jgi:DNA-binding transcriptional ArsR family regulator